MTKVELTHKLEVSGGSIRSTAKRRTALRLLLFLKRVKEKDNLPLPTGEIAESLDMDWGTAKHSLEKLTECGFLEIVPDEMDGRMQYFQIANEKATEKVIELYKRRVGFKLGRLIPYDKIHSEKLKFDKRFTELCKFYGLTFYQGLCAVEKCPKIGIEYIPGHQGEFYLWRNSTEGYIPPEEEKSEAKETEVVDI